MAANQPAHVPRLARRRRMPCRDRPKHDSKAASGSVDGAWPHILTPLWPASRLVKVNIVHRRDDARAAVHLHWEIPHIVALGCRQRTFRVSMPLMRAFCAL